MAVQDAPSGDVAAERRRAWTVFSVVFLACVVAAFNQSKVPPLIPALVEDIQLSIVEAGLLMSVLSVAGMVLALPAGLLFRRFGPRRAGLGGIGSLLLGALLGSLAPNSTWLLATRFLEGVGMGMSTVLALTTIAAWFPPQQRGLPIGIFTAWAPLGSLAMLLVAPPVYEVLGWRAVWLVGAAAALVCFVLYALLVEVPEQGEGRATVHKGSWRQSMLNPNAWLLSLSFACYQALRIALLTWAPTYLVSMAGLGLAAAAQVTSINQVVSIAANLACGWVLVRVGSPRKLYTVAWLLFLPMAALMLEVDPAWFAILFVSSAVVTSVNPVAVNAAAPETARSPSDTGPAVGIVAIGRNAGQVVGPVLFAVVLQATGGWEAVGIVLIGGTLLGLVSGWLVRVR